MFEFGEFRAASGQMLPYKIECDHLLPGDLECIANIMYPYLEPYGHVVGVPRGGLALARYFEKWKKRGCKTLLVVDDVWTTGGSMRAVIEGQMSLTRRGQPLYVDWQGVVIFARSRTPIKVRPFMIAMY